MDVSQYLEIFIDESKEHLQGLNRCLLELEKAPSDSKELVNEVFRSAHTLKGMAATMGYKKMNVMTHNMENVLSELRAGNMSFNAEILDTLFKCLDALEQYLEDIVQTGNEGDEDHPEIIASLVAILNGEKAGSPTPDVKESAVVAQVVEANSSSDEKEDDRKHKLLRFTDFERHAVQEATKAGMNSYGITMYLADTCVLKSARAFIIFRTLEELGSIIKSDPAVQDIEDEKFDFDFSVVLVSSEDVAKVKKELSNIAEVIKVLVDEVELGEPVATEKIVKVVSETEEKKPDKDVKNTGQKSTKPVTNRTVRVDIERLDTLMNLVSELIIIKNGLETVENNDSNFSEQIEYLERITTNLHDAVMKVRMVPVERVFNRFPRLIRDLSRKLEKKMVLHMSGEDTELDRTVIDEIGDPLVHLIRNSGDHGLETPDVRVANGKDEIGNVDLRAYQDGNNVVIEVSDDGAGIDVDKVKVKAINSGAITYDQAELMSEKEIIDLLFRPSFSTAEKITDVSGRGVGLDVVKTKIEALGGDIEVKTQLGKGSRFIIRLPLTLAIIQALMVELNNEKYAIPLNTIQNIEDVKVSDIKFIQNEEVINLRGRVIPIIRLHEKLDLIPDNTAPESLTIVIVNKGDKQAGFVVDALIGQQEIVIKTLGKYLTNIRMIAGATILGDGEVALILDVNSLV